MRLLLGSVDIAAPLAKVEIGLLLVEDTVNLEESCALVLIPQASLVAGEDCLNVQSEISTTR